MRIRTWLVAFSIALLPLTAHADDDGTTKALVANGAVATALGATALVVGGFVYWNAQAAFDRPDCGGSCTDASIVGSAAGMGLMSAGAIHLAVGIPLLAAGIHRRRVAAAPRVSAAVGPIQHGAAGHLAITF